VEYCEFNAIVVIPPVEFAEVNKSLCHSCGACAAACSFDAIIEKPFKIGEYQMYQNTIGNGLVEGKLEIGSAMQTMLIRKLKKQISDKHDIIIYDAPPGTSCPVVETISDSDYVILVTEPTPFGLYDLKLMVALMNEINISYGVIINKSGLGYDATYNFLMSEKIELLGNIPYMKEYASLYSNGDLLSNIPPEMEKTYTNIIHKLENKLTLYERNNHIER
jgi:MinD superfamily P-loop ATPase